MPAPPPNAYKHAQTAKSQFLIRRRRRPTRVQHNQNAAPIERSIGANEQDFPECHESITNLLFALARATVDEVQARGDHLHPLEPLSCLQYPPPGVRFPKVRRVGQTRGVCEG